MRVEPGNDPTVKVFVERAAEFDRDGDRKAPAALDAKDQQDWSEVLDLTPDAAAGRRSAVRLHHEKPVPYGGLREDQWYDLPTALLRTAAVEPVFPRSSLLFQADVFLRSGPDDFRQFRSDAPEGSAPKTMEPKALPWPTLGSTTQLDLHVIACGQGNWNELHTPDTVLIYDPGADMGWSADQVQALVNQQLGTYGEHSVHVVISHWDMDHYHALLGFDDAALRRIRSVVAPPPPNTGTAKRVLEALAAADVPVHLAAPVDRPPGERRLILREVHADGPLHWYRGVKSKNRNQAGIALLARGAVRDGLLTGDHHHRKLIDGLTVAGRTLNNPVLVVPHHGGKAGRFTAEDWADCSSGEATTALSAGVPNRYGHPLRWVCDRLTEWAGTPLATQGVEHCYMWPLGAPPLLGVYLDGDHERLAEADLTPEALAQRIAGLFNLDTQDGYIELGSGPDGRAVRWSVRDCSDGTCLYAGGVRTSRKA